MRRSVSVLVLLVAAALLLASGPMSSWHTASPAEAQTPPEVDITLYSSTVQYRTLPGSPVTAELLGPDGERKAEGLGFGPGAVAEVTFFEPGFGGTVPVRPGDTVVLSRVGESPLEVEVPELGAAVDVDADRVVGMAPAGDEVTVLVQTPDTTQPMTRTVTAGEDGMFALELSGELDLAPGAASGEASITTTDNFRFAAPFAALSAEVTYDASTMRGSATPGTQVQVMITRADGSQLEIAPSEVTNGTTYTAALAGGPPGSGQTGGPLAPGDTLVVTQSGGVGDVTQTISATLEAVTLELDPSEETVSGTAPAGQPVTVSGDDMDGRTVSRTVDSDAEGSYSVDLSADVDLGPGWRVRAAYEAGPGVTAGRLDVLRKARIGVHVPNLVGRAAPGQRVTVTLLSEAGEVQLRRPLSANDQGQYSTFLGSFDPSGGGPGGPEPGQTIELAFVDGDPLRLQVPDLTALADVEGDAVHGTAPASREVTVQVQTAPGAPRFTTTADVNDRYRVELGDALDLERPANGTVSLEVQAGNEFFTSWAALQVNAMMGNSIVPSLVFGNGPIGRAVHIELLDADGQLVAEAETTVFGGFVIVGNFGGVAPQYFVQLADVTGQPVEMQPGDTLRITAGDATQEITIPTLDAVVLVEQDTISGRTLPDSPVTIQLSQDPPNIGAQAETTSDGQGNFVHTFDDLDVRYGDFVQLTVGVEGHNVMNALLAPGILLDLDAAQVLGSLAPDAKLTITLRRGDEVLGEQTLFADEIGAFAVQFAGADGTPLVIRPDDVVRVQPDDPELDTLELTVPELTVDWDKDADIVRGSATPGGSLTALALQAYSRGDSFGIAQAWPAIEGAAWQADFVPAPNVRPGSRFIALYRPPEGHYVLRTRTVPIVNAQHSGPNVCGFGLPRFDVLGQLLGMGGQERATFAEAARFDGYFSAVWRDTEDEPVVTGAAQEIRAQLGAETEGRLTLPVLDLEVDWEQGMISGQGPANTVVNVTNAVPCPLQQQPQGVNITIGGFALQTETDDDGAFDSFLPPFFSQPGSGVEIAFFSETDHRYFRQVYRALAQVFIHTERVSGQANPLEPVTVRLQGAEGEVRAEASTTADPMGRFTVELRDEAGDPLAIAADETVVLETPGETPEVLVEPLSFDWSPGTGVAGRGPAGRTVQLDMRLNTGQVLGLELDINDEGAFQFEDDDVPVRADWTMDDVVGVRLTLETAGGHQIIDQSEGFEMGPRPQPSKPTIYLPAAYTGRALSHAAEAAPRTASEADADSAAAAIDLRPTVNVEPVEVDAARATWTELMEARNRAPTASDSPTLLLGRRVPDRAVRPGAPQPVHPPMALDVGWPMYR